MKNKPTTIISASLVVLMFISIFYFFDINEIVENFKTRNYPTELEDDGIKIYRYYYEQLKDNEKQAYINIYNALDEHPEKIEIPQLTEEGLDKVFKALNYDNPQLLCLGSVCRMLASSGRYYFIPEYTLSLEECITKTSELMEKVEMISAGISKNSSDFEKELYVHNYIVQNTEYVDDQNADDAHNALIEGKSICSGYAKATQLLLSVLDMKSLIITGKATDDSGNVENHMWNIVYVDGEPYHLDATWNDPVSENEGNLRHVYFNLNTEELSATHSDFSINYIECLATQANYFRMTGKMFDKFDNDTVSNIVLLLSDKVINGQSSIEIRFDSKETFENAVSTLFEKNGIYDILEKVKSNTGVPISTTSVRYSTNDNLFVMLIITV